MNVCVFCGSATGTDPVFSAAARSLGQLLAKHSITLVYGGGRIGLMGVVADAVMQAGGQVVGVIPDFLVKKEVGHQSITRLEVVESMHQRKTRMAELADAFIAMPGGWGTLEELAEILTWRQLELIHEPIGVLNTAGFFDPLINQMKHMVEHGFLRGANLNLLTVEATPEKLLSSLLVTATPKR